MHTGQVLLETLGSSDDAEKPLRSLATKASKARQIAGDVLSDVVRLNTGRGLWMSPPLPGEVCATK